jgi:hypothetical protein
MNKQDIELRISALLVELLRNDNETVQATYGAELALKTKEYSHVLRCAQHLITYDIKNEEIIKELKELREKIDKSDHDDSGGLIF